MLQKEHAQVTPQTGIFCVELEPDLETIVSRRAAFFQNGAIVASHVTVSRQIPKVAVVTRRTKPQIAVDPRLSGQDHAVSKVH